MKSKITLKKCLTLIELFIKNKVNLKEEVIISSKTFKSLKRKLGVKGNMIEITVSDRKLLFMEE